MEFSGYSTERKEGLWDMEKEELLGCKHINIVVMNPLRKWCEDCGAITSVVDVNKDGWIYPNNTRHPSQLAPNKSDLIIRFMSGIYGFCHKDASLIADYIVENYSVPSQLVALNKKELSLKAFEYLINNPSSLSVSFMFTIAQLHGFISTLGTPVNKELVIALEKLARLGNGDKYGNSEGNTIAQEALAKVKG